MKHLCAVAALGLALLASQVFVSESRSEEEQERIRVDEKSTNIRKNSLEWTEVMGEVVNETGFVIGYVKGAVTLKDRNGKVVDTGLSYVNGRTVEVDGFRTDTGIFPGGHAPFLGMFIETRVENVASVEYIVSYDVAGPRTDLDETPVLLRISRIDSLAQDNQGQIQTLKTRIDELSTGIGDASGSTVLGDLDNDHDVDFSDFLIFARNYGTGT